MQLKTHVVFAKRIVRALTSVVQLFVCSTHYFSRSTFSFADKNSIVLKSSGITVGTVETMMSNRRKNDSEISFETNRR